MRKTPLVLALLLSAPALLFADTVQLKGAGSFEGRITEQTDTMVMIDTGDGTIGVPMDRVQKIVKGRSALDEYDARAAKLGPDDINGWRSLGRWAAQAGISTQSQQAYQKVLPLAPNDAEAREALGYVQYNGQWMTEEESYRARGFINYEGEWMTPAEAQTIQASQAADQARRDAEQRAIDAEVKTAEAEARADEAEKRAKEAEEHQYQYGYPLYWGGYGYGVNYWPSTATIRSTNSPIRGSSPSIRVPR